MDRDTAIYQERFRLTMEMFETGVAMMRENLKRQFPEATESEIEARLVEWLRHRPGAEHGDCAGRPVPWPRRKT